MKYILTCVLILQSLIVFDSARQRMEDRQLIQKYTPLEQALSEVKKSKYQDGHKCLEFSKELVEKLKSNGIQASILIGEDQFTLSDPKTKHAWVAVWLEPQTGDFTKNYLYER